jgi:hypothetical protein
VPQRRRQISGQPRTEHLTRAEGDHRNPPGPDLDEPGQPSRGEDRAQLGRGLRLLARPAGRGVTAGIAVGMGQQLGVGVPRWGQPAARGGIMGTARGQHDDGAVCQVGQQ